MSIAEEKDKCEAVLMPSDGIPPNGCEGALHEKEDCNGGYRQAKEKLCGI